MCLFKQRWQVFCIYLITPLINLSQVNINLWSSLLSSLVVWIRMKYCALENLPKKIKSKLFVKGDFLGINCFCCLAQHTKTQTKGLLAKIRLLYVMFLPFLFLCQQLNYISCRLQIINMFTKEEAAEIFVRGNRKN